MKYYFMTKKVIPKELFTMLCSASLKKKSRKLDKWRTKDDVAGVKNLSSADEQYLRVERVAAETLVDPGAVH